MRKQNLLLRKESIYQQIPKIFQEVTACFYMFFYMFFLAFFLHEKCSVREEQIISKISSVLTMNYELRMINFRVRVGGVTNKL